MKARRTHYSFSHSQRLIPQCFLHQVYTYDDENPYLTIGREHTIGDTVSFLDLRYWDDPKESIESLIPLIHKRLTHLDISTRPNIDINFLNSVSDKFGHALQCLDMSGYGGNMKSQIVIETIFSFKNLVFLNVSNCSILIDDTSATKISNLPSLTSLNISRCWNLTDQALIILSNGIGSRLLELDASFNNKFTFVGVNEVLIRCAYIEILSISNCPNIKHMGIVVSSNDGLRPLYASRSFRKINVEGCQDLSEESFNWILTANSDLEEVNLSNTKHLSESALLGMIQSCQSTLRILSINGCRNISDLTIDLISRRCKSLVELNIKRIGNTFSSRSARHLMLSCKDLAKLDLSNNSNIGDEAFFDISSIRKSYADIVDGSGTDQSHEQLQLSWVCLADSAVTGLGVVHLAEYGQLLQHLDLCGLKYMADSAVAVLSQHCTQLRHLWMDDCPALTDAAVILCAYGLPRLISIHLSSSDNLFYDSSGDPMYHKQYTDDTVEALLDGARNLQELTLRNQNGILLKSKWFTSGFINRAGHFSLQRLDLMGCDFINMRGAAAIFSHCTNINEVILSKRLPHGFKSRKFWEASFSKAVYCLPFEDKRSLSNVLHFNAAADLATTRKQTDVSSFVGSKNDLTLDASKESHLLRRNDYFSTRLPIGEKDDGEFRILMPHPNATKWKFLDSFCRTRLREVYAARVIQEAWSKHLLWRKIGRHVSAFRIANWYKKILDHRHKMKTLREFVDRRAATIIQRGYRSLLGKNVKASIKIQKISRGFLGRKYAKIYRIKRDAAVIIQKFARGMIFRLTDRYLLFQVYRNLPLFWRKIFRYRV